MRVYYAHAMCLYGTRAEQIELTRIERYLPYYVVVDPGKLQGQANRSSDAMRFFLRVVRFCDAVVFSRLLGEITAGVGLEVNHALALGIPVYELNYDGVMEVTQSVVALSREETIARYEAWRAMNRGAE